jgi:transcriptional regulator with XRE-family HTH domain
MIVSGEQIRAARARLGWSQTDLARVTGLHRNSICYWERHQDIRCQNSNGAVAWMREAFERVGIHFSELSRPCRPRPRAAQFYRVPPPLCVRAHIMGSYTCVRE